MTFVAGADLTAEDLNQAIGSQFTQYTPAWTASIAPLIGNGTLTAVWCKVGLLVTVRLNLLAGTTTTFGSGEWSFALPEPAAVVSPTFTNKPIWSGAAEAHDAGTAYYSGYVGVMSGASTLFIHSHNVTTKWGSASPMTWGNLDYLAAQITYQAAS